MNNKIIEKEIEVMELKITQILRDDDVNEDIIREIIDKITELKERINDGIS